MGRNLVEFKGEGGKVTGITLDGGETLPAELVVVGAGAIPNTKLFEAAEDDGIIDLARDDSILTDEVTYHRITQPPSRNALAPSFYLSDIMCLLEGISLVSLIG